MRAIHRFLFFPAMLGAGVSLLAACGRSDAPSPSPSSSAGAASAAAPGTAAPAHAATVADHGLPPDQVSTSRYRIDIRYPALPASAVTLQRQLHATGTAAKREFMRGLPDPDRFPEFADRQLTLKIDFTIAARMPRFISVREQGMADTGGAHPMPVDASFVYDTRADKVLALADLFTQPDDVRRRLSELARKQLETSLLAKVPGGARTSAEARREWVDNMRGMIHDGTTPSAENFSQFVVLGGAGDRASGLQLIFSPYQVAPYVYGSQTVDVPVEAFADLLKPAYRDAFDGADAGG